MTILSREADKKANWIEEITGAKCTGGSISPVRTRFNMDRPVLAVLLDNITAVVSSRGDDVSIIDGGRVIQVLRDPPLSVIQGEIPIGARAVVALGMTTKDEPLLLDLENIRKIGEPVVVANFEARQRVFAILGASAVKVGLKLRKGDADTLVIVDEHDEVVNRVVGVDRLKDTIGKPKLTFFSADGRNFETISSEPPVSFRLARID